MITRKWWIVTAVHEGRTYRQEVSVTDFGLSPETQMNVAKQTGTQIISNQYGIPVSSLTNIEATRKGKSDETV